MKKILNGIKNHKILVTIITVFVFAAPLVVVHVLFKSSAIHSWFVATWSAGDLLGYIAGFASLLGTVFLGLITVYLTDQANETSERLGKENINLQKIMAQKLMPILRLEFAHIFKSTVINHTPSHFPQKAEFMRTCTCSGNMSSSVCHKIYVNIDVGTENRDPVYVKQINFRLVNISDTIIRHISLDHIQIVGYENRAEPVLCQNEATGDGIPTLITTDESVDVMLIAYTNSEERASVWDDSSGGLALTLYVTNTSISGIQFHEYINVHATDGNYVKISYGERTAVAGDQENTQ